MHKKWMAAVALAAGMIAFAGCDTLDGGSKVPADMKTVASDAIDAVSYDEAAETMTVTFDKGGTYKYSGVPSKIYDELMAAESKGAYIAESVKGKFDAEKIK